jgi:hypothetical protein
VHNEQHHEREFLDEELGAVVRRLRAVPASDPHARAAILARVRGRRPAPWRAALAMAWQPSIPFLAAASLAVVALGAGYAARVLVEPGRSVVMAVAEPSDLTLVPVVDDGRVPVQFVLSDSAARSVSLVGDFNGWGETQAVLRDPTRSGVWEVTLLLSPGRHTYAFLVNDSIWTIDPRMATSADAEYGRPSSVVLVTK